MSSPYSCCSCWPVLQRRSLIRIPIPSGDVNLPVAEVNTGHQPVAVEHATWGKVKSLLR